MIQTYLKPVDSTACLHYVCYARRVALCFSHCCSWSGKRIVAKASVSSFKASKLLPHSSALVLAPSPGYKWLQGASEEALKQSEAHR